MRSSWQPSIHHQWWNGIKVMNMKDLEYKELEKLYRRFSNYFNFNFIMYVKVQFRWFLRWKNCCKYTVFYFVADSERTRSTKDDGPSKRWMTVLPPEKETRRTDSWNEELGFNKIEVVDRIVDENRGHLEEKYYCKRDDKRVRRGFHYFDYENCLVWHCPKWPMPVGVWEFEYHKWVKTRVPT